MRSLRRRTSVALLALAALLAVLLPPGVQDVAEASAVPKGVCGRYDAGVSRGVCVRDGDGRIYWLGTLRGYDGIELYCIDYLFATAWGVRHERVTVSGDLPTSLGGRVGRPTVAALNHLVTRHPAARADDTTAGAIGLIIRQVMGDVRRGAGSPIPGGLTVASSVRDVGFVPDAVVARARYLWDQAREHRGPWSLRVRIDPGPDGKVVVGERVSAVVRGTNGTGNPQGMTAALRYRGFTGPATVSLGADGVARVRMRAPASPSAGSISLRVGDAPGVRPVVIRPVGWTTNPRPGRPSSISQRGLIGTQSVVVAEAAATAEIVKARPRLVTQVSSQRVLPGAAIHDTVVVSGSGGMVGAFTWSLHGPLPATDGVCPGAEDDRWATAPVAATGSVLVRGDGTYRTPDHRVTVGQVGCLTYSESMPGTTTTWPAASPPGLPAETALVDRPADRPCVSTQVSRQQARVGSRISDQVRIGCLPATTRVDVRWTLHGPAAARPGRGGTAGCRGIPAATWARVPVAARGVLRAVGRGVHRTRPVIVRAPGCFTYSEVIPRTATTTGASTPPGLPAETALVSRPPLVTVPEVPTGPEGSGFGPVATRAALATTLGAVGSANRSAVAEERWLPGPAGRASHLRQRYLRPPAARSARSGGVLRLPASGIRLPVEVVGTHRGVMAVPDDPGRVGWLTATAKSSDVVGASVLAGHVSDRRDRPGPLARLASARRGDRLLWTDAAGRTHRFRVTTLHRFPRSGGLPPWVFRTDGPHLVRVVTCSGRVARPGGGFHYRDNLVLTALVSG